MHPRNVSEPERSSDGTVGPRRRINVVEGQLICPSNRVADLTRVFGAAAPVRPLAQFTPGKQAAASLTLVEVGGPTPILQQLELLAAKDATLFAVVTANYILQPWVSSGGDGVPKPTDRTPPIGDFAGDGKVVVFDSGLLVNYEDGHPYLAHVDPAGVADLIPLPAAGAPMGLFDCHGMFVSGVLACAAPAAHVVVRRVFDVTGGVDDWTLSNAIDNYLHDHSEVRLVNLSCGTFADPQHAPAALQLMIQTHGNVLFVAAAGNVSGGTPQLPAYPAAFPEVVGVGAVDSAGHPTTFSDSLSTDVLALGQAVDNAFGAGTVANDVIKAGPFTRSATWSGTSFAAPLVCAALLEFMAAPPQDVALATAAVDWLAARFPSLDDKPVVPAPIRVQGHVAPPGG
ncbi:MAG: hypothetical protein V7637_3091 [Mycobacteriales bacterium]